MKNTLLQCQLDLAGLSLDTPPDLAAWTQFITALNQDLRHHSEQQSLYRTFFNQTHDAVAILDLDGSVIDVNECMLQMLGYTSRSEMIGQPAFWFARPGDNQAATADNLKRLKEGQRSIFSERELMRRDGTIVVIEGYGDVVLDDDGAPIYVLAVIHDITHHKTFQAELSRSKAMLTDLLNHIPVGVLAQNRDAKIIYSNPAAYELLGLTEDQFLGRTSFDPTWNVIHEDSSDFPGEEHPGPVALATGEPVWNVVMGVYRPDNQDRAWILVNALPQAANNSEIGVLVTFSDITVQRQAIEQAHQIKAQQAIAERSQQLMESIGHDFRTPLSVISTSLYLLKRKTLGNSNLFHHVEMLEAQSEQINWLIEEALLMSKLDSGLIQPGLVLNSVNLVAREVIRKLEGQFVAKTQFIRCELGGSLPKVALDWHYLSIAVEHVLLNASQYGPVNGSIRISSARNGDTVEINIEDSGPGLTEFEQTHIFDRMYKVNSARTDGGSGLGLPITREIMKLHSGTIRVESEPGKGSRFILALPIPSPIG